MAVFDTTNRGGRSSAPAAGGGRMTAAGLVVASLLLGVILVELFCYFFVPSIGRASANERLLDWGHRIIFFDGNGSIFQNHGDIFTYVPHNDIRNVLGYFSNDGFKVEYDYRFHTNNYGLVQDSDVVPARPSILLLGDSFTEGQGSEPWFRQLAAQSNGLPYQLINGGLSGTGFEQWSKLEHSLSAEHVQIRKLVVLFISDDYRRGVWNFSQPELRCLQSAAACSGNEWYSRMPPANELAATVDKIRAVRDTPRTRLVQRARAILPASFRVYDYLRAEFLSDSEHARQRARTTIADFINEHGRDNVVFMHLPQKDEMAGPNASGTEERRAIQEAGGKLYDGFKLCNLTAADYHIRDPHPNAQGYAKIASCVNQVIRQIGASVQ
jgi:hypothetical protein